MSVKALNLFGNGHVVVNQRIFLVKIHAFQIIGTVCIHNEKISDLSKKVSEATSMINDPDRMAVDFCSSHNGHVVVNQRIFLVKIHAFQIIGTVYASVGRKQIAHNDSHEGAFA